MLPTRTGEAAVDMEQYVMLESGPGERAETGEAKVDADMNVPVTMGPGPIFRSGSSVALELSFELV